MSYRGTSRSKETLMRIPLALGVVTTIAVTTLAPSLSAQATAERPLTPPPAAERQAPGVETHLKRSEERRVGKEGRSQWAAYPVKKKKERRVQGEALEAYT